MNAPEYFNEVWRRLARAGIVDEEGGAEYQRVSAAWEAREGPADPEVFILHEVGYAVPPGQGGRVLPFWEYYNRRK